MPELPLVSIVTPSLNTAAFVSQAIGSVLEQDYPRIEYLVMDGGSSDETVSILKGYAGRVAYRSWPDGGAAEAIRHGMERSKGEILAYLNADDVYLPGAISAAVRFFEDNPEAAVVYGEGLWVDEGGTSIARYPTCEFDSDALARECFICQPAAFFRRSAYESVGGMDPRLQYTFDYDLWLRLARNHRFAYLKQPLAKSRMYPGNKTLGARRGVFRETISTARANSGYAGFGHVYAYACHLVDGRDQFFEPLRPSIFKYCLALALGAGFNGVTCGRFWSEAIASVRLLREARARALDVTRSIIRFASTVMNL